MAKREWESITISITPGQKEALERRAEQEACSMSLLVRKAIDMFLAQPALFGVIGKPEPAPQQERTTS